MDRKRIIIVALAFLALAIILGGFLFLKQDKIPDETSKESILSQAVNLANAGQFGQAEQILLGEITKNPSLDLKLALASIYLDEGFIRETQVEASKKAQKVLNELEKENKTSEVYSLLGKSYEIVGNFDKAIEYYEKSEKNSSETLYSLGHAYYKKGDSIKALEYYTQAEKLIGKDTNNSIKSNIYAGLGNLSKDYPKAEQYFLKSIESSGSSFSKSQNYSNLANLMLLQKDSDKALEYAQKALEEDSSNEIAHLAYTKAAMSDKAFLESNKDKIEESLLKAIFLSPTKAEPQYWQGKFDFVMGETDLAIKSFEKALSLVEQDSSLNNQSRNSLKGDINLDMALIYTLKDDNESAKQYAKEALSYNPIVTMYILQNTLQLKELYEMVKTQ